MNPTNADSAAGRPGSEPTGSDHLVIVFYAGDFGEAQRRRAGDLGPLWRGHPEILATADRLAAAGCTTTLVSCIDAEQERVEIAPGVFYQALGVLPFDEPDRVVAAIDRLAPTHLIPHFPLDALLRFAHSGRDRFRTLAMNANTFTERGPKAMIARNRTVAALNGAGIDFVANHGRAATMNYAMAGVDPRRLLAYDFEHDLDPAAPPIRTLRPEAVQSPRLFYVGYVSQAKGVFDLIDAVGRLVADGRSPTLRIAGRGDLDDAHAQIGRCGAEGHVEILGAVDNDDVQAEMSSADLVVVPSRHEFPEGFPLTMFEAIASRTPIVASDHPVFTALLDRDDVSMFTGGDPADCARAVVDALDADRYRAWSEMAPRTWAKIQTELKWADLVWHWQQGDREWIRRHVAADQSWFVPRPGLLSRWLRAGTDGVDRLRSLRRRP